MLDIPNICFYNKHMFELHSDLTTMKKLEILADAAKYDVACTSSGVDSLRFSGAFCAFP